MVKSYRFKFPNFRIGPCGISSAYRAHFPPLIVRARVRIIPCGFRSIWCGNSAVNGAEIPQDRCISAAYHAISAGHSALPHVAVRKFRTVQFGNLHLYALIVQYGLPYLIKIAIWQSRNVKVFIKNFSLTPSVLVTVTPLYPLIYLLSKFSLFL